MLVVESSCALEQTANNRKVAWQNFLARRVPRLLRSSFDPTAHLGRRCGRIEVSCRRIIAHYRAVFQVCTPVGWPSQTTNLLILRRFAAGRCGDQIVRPAAEARKHGKSANPYCSGSSRRNEAELGQ